jgi:hypothetical protein
MWLLTLYFTCIAAGVNEDLAATPLPGKTAWQNSGGERGNKGTGGAAFD